MINYLGHNVQAEIDVADVSEDGASWGYVLDMPANTVDLHVIEFKQRRCEFILQKVKLGWRSTRR